MLKENLTRVNLSIPLNLENLFLFLPKLNAEAYWEIRGVLGYLKYPEIPSVHSSKTLLQSTLFPWTLSALKTTPPFLKYV